MGQVPAEKTSGALAPYLLVGDGKLAGHLAFYLETLGLPFRRWSRRASPAPLTELAGNSSRVLLAVSDGAIEELARACGASPTRVHFSGSLTTSLAYGAHPLMSFPAKLFAPERYVRIPFIIERGGPPFSDLLPGLPNPSFAIDPSGKAFYHALCVLSGNFTVLLWQKFFDELGTRFAIPREAALEYLRAIALNLEAERFPLTGPLARGDQATIARNLAALEGDPFHGVYESFVRAFQRGEEKRLPIRANAPDNLSRQEVLLP